MHRVVGVCADDESVGALLAAAILAVERESAFRRRDEKVLEIRLDALALGQVDYATARFGAAVGVV